jgi:hypothetical protein
MAGTRWDSDSRHWALASPEKQQAASPKGPMQQLVDSGQQSP